MEMGIAGKVAAVTGASKGIGRAIAMALGKEAGRLSLASRNAGELEKTASEIRKECGIDVFAVPVDLSIKSDQKKFIEKTVERYGRIDILVNNAGGGFVGDLLTTPDDAWDYHFNLKLLGYIRLAREAIPHMQKSGGGVIVNIVGGYGKEPDGHAILPGVVNAGLLNFTRAAAGYFAKDNIRIVSINPAVTQTDLMHEMASQIAQSIGATTDAVENMMEKAFPLKRIGKPGDIANSVVFLASDAASFITGVSLSVDGGIGRGL